MTARREGEIRVFMARTAAPSTRLPLTTNDDVTDVTGQYSTDPAPLARPLSRGERVLDNAINVLGLTGSVVGVVILMGLAIERNDPLLTLSLGLYSAGLLAMQASSALYNAHSGSSRAELFRRLDHAAIFVMIAGTYTPFLIVKMGNTWGIALLLYVWLVAFLGMIVKLLSVRRLERLSVILYLFLGWTILAAMPPLVDAVPLPAIVLLVAGGLLYSVGVVFYLWERLLYQQAIWHGFVVAAAACHYVAVLGGVVLPETFS